MNFPSVRLRRLRRTKNLRCLVQEEHLHPRSFIMPMFIVPGSGIRKEISSLPGVFHISLDQVAKEANDILEAGIRSVLLFGIPENKDPIGAVACQPDGIIQKAVQEIKSKFPELVVITDLCFCEYTSHGHCGILKGQHVDNDATLEMLGKQALSHAVAGADIIAPSGMMDGTVGSVRRDLDRGGFENTAIMSYSAKFSSAFYGPFRDAVHSTPAFGDRREYQMSSSNGREALREIEQDIIEGADIVMVKPALPYLDIIANARERFDIPIAAYQVSGEYTMIKLAGANGSMNEEQLMLESLVAIRRAGADMVISYFACEFAKLWKRGAVE